MRTVRQIAMALLIVLMAVPSVVRAEASVDAGKKSKMRACVEGRIGSYLSSPYGPIAAFSYATVASVYTYVAYNNYQRARRAQ